MRRTLWLLLVFSLLLVPSVTRAEDQQVLPGPVNEDQMAALKKGWGFGLGIGFTRTFGRDRIESAINDNGVVRIDGEKNAIPRIMLETHLLWTFERWSHVWSCNVWRSIDTKCKEKTASAKQHDEDDWIRVGPFVAIQPGSGEIIQAIAGGIMVGFKDPKKDPLPFNNINIGLGISVEPNSRTLGDGLHANQPVPDGATVRTQTRSLAGFTIMVSTGF